MAFAVRTGIQQGDRSLTTTSIWKAGGELETQIRQRAEGRQVEGYLHEFLVKEGRL